MGILTKVHHRCWILAALLISVLAAGCTQSTPTTSPMEVTHAAYLDLAGNITDLRARVAEWQKGDEGSLNIAKEKLERIAIILDATSWPRVMVDAITKTRAAVDPMGRALERQDRTAAEAASMEFGDAAHDVTHTFYGDWLPELEDKRSAQMAAHVIYLDLAANISDLQTRVAAWQMGDESSINIAKEKAERAEILLLHMYSTGVMTRHLPAIQQALPSLLAAIETKDVGAAQQAIRPILEEFREMDQNAYAWMDIVTAGNDPACVQASYLDLSRNISGLRASVAAWLKGDENSLAVAEERLIRVQTLISHPLWPGEMAGAIDRTRAAAGPMGKALREKNLAAAKTISDEFGEASHDITHTYYGDWLPNGGLTTSGSQAITGTSGQSKKVSSGAHGHESAAERSAAANSQPNWSIIGGFAVTLALVIGIAAATKPKGTRKAAAVSLPDTGEA